MTTLTRQEANELKKLKRAVTGPHGLLLAIMATAVLDYASGNDKQRQSAADYFSSDLYQRHLSWLGMAGDWRPVVTA